MRGQCPQQLPWHRRKEPQQRAPQLLLPQCLPGAQPSCPISWCYQHASSQSTQTKHDLLALQGLLYCQCEILYPCCSLLCCSEFALKEPVNRSNDWSSASGSRVNTGGCDIKAHTPRQCRSKSLPESLEVKINKGKKMKLSLPRQIERSVAELEDRV